uniref:Uncharacterized protein n=1 Tax=Panagrolaimus sp. PS1159 TaxID=55785 RepID=A0AC35EX47_9BILA
MNNQSMSSSSNFQQNNPFVITIDTVAPERSQMSERRSSSIPEYVEVPRGNFCKTEEIIRGKPVIRLYVKEPGLPNGFIRKYTPTMVKKRMKWYCTQCNTRRNSRANSNKSVAMKTTNILPKEAKYNETTLFHAITCCKPFKGELKADCKIYPNGEAPAAATCIRIEMPRFSLPLPSNGLDSVLADIAPLSSPRILWSSNARNNPLRTDMPCSSRTIIPPQSPSSSIVNNVSQPVPPPPLFSIDPVPPQLAAAVVGNTVQPQPVPASFVANNVAEEAQSNDNEPAPRNNVFQRSDGSITEGAGNYSEEEEEEEENSREKSTISLPEDVGIIAERIVAKKEPNSQVLIEEKEDEMEIKNEYDPDPAILSFKRPSEGALMSACRKVGLVYDDAAYVFWANNINVKLVKALSDSIQPGPWSNGFDCLSLFLTGSHKFGPQMQVNVNPKWYSDPVLKANYNNEQQKQMLLKFNDEHFKLIAHWLSCRIGVYENGILKKYGDWTSMNSNELIILIAKDGERYAPVYGL